MKTQGDALTHILQSGKNLKHGEHPETSLYAIASGGRPLAGFHEKFGGLLCGFGMVHFSKGASR